MMYSILFYHCEDPDCHSASRLLDVAESQDHRLERLRFQDKQSPNIRRKIP